MKLILGSTSPRRREILEFFSLPFVQEAPTFDEESVPFNGDPAAYAIALAEQKADSLVEKFPDEWILTADTVVYCDGRIYNKPRDRKEWAQFLSELSGKWNMVTTALSLRKGDWQKSMADQSRILFCKLNSDQIERYMDGVHALDKAGGYAIQGAGSILVAKIEGCYYNVMGLPVQTLKELLLCAGIDLWHYL